MPGGREGWRLSCSTLAFLFCAADLLGTQDDLPSTANQQREHKASKEGRPRTRCWGGVRCCRPGRGVSVEIEDCTDSIILAAKKNMPEKRPEGKRPNTSDRELERTPSKAALLTPELLLPLAGLRGCTPSVSRRSGQGAGSRAAGSEGSDRVLWQNPKGNECFVLLPSLAAWLEEA